MTKLANIYKPILIWSIALILAFFAASQSLAIVMQRANPALASGFWPANGMAHQAIAEALLAREVQESGSQIPESIKAKTVGHARQAFLSEPAVPEALSIVAMSLDAAEQARMMDEVEKLSRRNQILIGWKIIDSGKREDLDGVLKYYDISLRGNAAARDALLPTMAASLQNDDLVEPFRKLLAQQPPWSEYFWIWVARSPQSLENAANLRMGLVGEDIPKRVFRDEWLVEQLAVTEKFEKASALRSVLKPLPKNGGVYVRNADFDEQSYFPPLDWELVSNGDYGAGLNGQYGTLDLSAVGGSNGRFARQLVELPAEKLQLQVTMTDAPPASAVITLSLSCADRENASLAFRLNRAKLSAILDLTKSDCTYYWLEIKGRTASDSEGFDVSFDAIKIAARSKSDEEL
ncbi:MAG: hypothetical protein AAGM33_09075 [Pseudomonadota bacterium]